jgi:hypothetical protein
MHFEVLLSRAARVLFSSKWERIRQQDTHSASGAFIRCNRCPVAALLSRHFGHGLQHRGKVGRAGNRLHPILPAAPPNVTESACLAAKIEQMFHTGSAAYPVERTLLTTGLLEACLHSRHKLNQRVETPQLAVSYQPSAESQYARI